MSIYQPQSAVEAFARSLDRKTQPGDAIHNALEGIDVTKLADFVSHVEAGVSANRQHPGAEVLGGRLFVNALRATEGTNQKANAEFATKIQAALRASEGSLDRDLPLSPAIANGHTVAEGQRAIHTFMTDIDHAIGHYVASQDPSRSPMPQRRHFDRKQLIEAQHVAAKTASVAEIKDLQSELKAEGHDIGTFGKQHDGIDGKAGRFTLQALAQAMKKQSTFSSP